MKPGRRKKSALLKIERRWDRRHNKQSKIWHSCWIYKVVSQLTQHSAFLLQDLVMFCDSSSFEPPPHGEIIVKLERVVEAICLIRNALACEAYARYLLWGWGFRWLPAVPVAWRFKVQLQLFWSSEPWNTHHEISKHSQVSVREMWIRFMLFYISFVETYCTRMGMFQEI